MIPNNARKKFRFNPAPSDRQLWAIGVVVVQWAAIEEMVKVFVHSFTDKKNPNDPLRKQFDAIRPMQKRIDVWEDLSKVGLKPEWVRSMLEIINETRNIQDLRDKIVHGTWGDKKTVEQGADTHGPFSLGKPGHPFDWKLDYGGILNVAVRIDHLHARMFDLALTANGEGQVPQFRFGDALRRIQQ